MFNQAVKQVKAAGMVLAFVLLAMPLVSAGQSFASRVAAPDLRIESYKFASADDKVVRVRVANDGNAAAGACRLVLTVREINGVAVGRKTHVNVPALVAKKGVWLAINAKDILPANVALEATIFRLNVDATEIVNELDENNNEVLHNL